MWRKKDIKEHAVHCQKQAQGLEEPNKTYYHVHKEEASFATKKEVLHRS